MKYCTQCGHANDDDALFCEKDGCRLDKTVEDIQSKDIKTQVCEKCGFENGMDMKFCGKCGNVLDKNKKKRNGGTPIVTVFSLLFVVVVCICVAASYDRDFSDWFKIIQGWGKEATYLNVSVNKMFFKGDGQAFREGYYDGYNNRAFGIDKCEIIVDTDGRWDVDSPGWCSIKKMKNSFIVSCKPNIMVDDNRGDTIRVVAGRFEEKISVWQDSKGHYILPKERYFKIDDNGGFIYLELIEDEYNKEYTLNTKESDWEWIDWGRYDKGIRFKISRNLGGSRSAKIKISGSNGGYCDIIIRQEGNED